MKKLKEKSKQNIKGLGNKIRSLSETKVVGALQGVVKKGKDISGKYVLRAPGKLFPARERSQTVCEFTDTHIKVVHVVKTRGKESTIRYFVKECLDLQDQEKSKLLRELFLEENITSKEVTLVIPHQAAFVRTLRLPSLDKNEIAEMVRYHRYHEVPLSPERIVCGYHTFSKGSDGYSIVYLSIVDRHIVDRYMTILKDGGVEPGSIRLDTEGIHNFVICSYPESSRVQGKSFALIDLDFDSTAVGFIIDGELTFTRSISVGARGLSNDKSPGSGAQVKSSRDRLIDELLKTFGLFGRETSQQKLSGIILSGVVESYETVKENLEDVFNLPVEKVFPFEPAQEDEVSYGTKKSLSRTDEFSFTSLLGLSVFDPAECIDLLPGELIEKRRKRERRREISRTGILAVLLALLTGLILKGEFTKREHYLSVLETEINTMLPVSSRIEKMENRLKALNSRLTNRGRALDVLREIHMLLPPDISLNLFSFTKGKAVVLKGTALHMSNVFSLVPKLEESGYFRSVSVGYASKRVIGDGEITDFQISMKIEEKDYRDENP